eukprot:scaffold16_cov147-Skeletonema_menzelii.AAC.11
MHSKFHAFWTLSQTANLVAGWLLQWLDFEKMMQMQSSNGRRMATICILQLEVNPGNHCNIGSLLYHPKVPQ